MNDATQLRKALVTAHRALAEAERLLDSNRLADQLRDGDHLALCLAAQGNLLALMDALAHDLPEATATISPAVTIKLNRRAGQ
jgi:hypothetical protein